MKGKRFGLAIVAAAACVCACRLVGGDVYSGKWRVYSWPQISSWCASSVAAQPEVADSADYPELAISGDGSFYDVKVDFTKMKSPPAPYWKALQDRIAQLKAQKDTRGVSECFQSLRVSENATQDELAAAWIGVFENPEHPHWIAGKYALGNNGQSIKLMTGNIELDYDKGTRLLCFDRNCFKRE